jgi:Na+-transporting methylmalonyl-CoA/oxaloacetate decarboxylase gamma subunit
MPITNALWISLIGMGLVFISILLLWGLMALLVRLVAERKAPEAEPAAAADKRQTSIPEEALLLSRKRRAAAAAVAVALAMAQDERQQTRPVGAPQAPVVGVWQAVNRAGQLGQRGQSSRRK